MNGAEPDTDGGRTGPSLLEEVANRTSDETAQLLRAVWGRDALRDGALDDLLARASTGSRDDSDPPTTYGTVWLRELSVAGFRGAGAQAVSPENGEATPVRLALPCRPELTVLTGRNGSGKSSLVEALEWSCTGRVERTESLPDPFKKAQTNRHVAGGERVAVTFEIDGDTKTFTRTQLDANGTDATLAGLFSLHRPVLTPVELRRVQGKPSDLHQAFASGLGLDDLSNAIDTLTAAQEQRRRIANAHLSRSDGIARELDASAAAAEPEDSAQLTRIAEAIRTRDGNAVGLIDEYVAAARQGTVASPATVRLPSQADTSRLRSRLNDAVAGLEQAEREANAGGRLAVDVLTAALPWARSVTLPASCPVCNAGSIDANWIDEAQATVEAFQAANAQLHIARNALESVTNEIRSIVPASLEVDDATRADHALAINALTTMRSVAASSQPGDLLDQFDEHRPLVEALNRDLEQLQADQTAARMAHVSAASPWARGLTAATASRTDADRIEAAVTELKKALADVMKASFQPLKELTQCLWEQLAPDSALRLADIKVVAGKQKRVDPTIELAPLKPGGKAESQKGFGFLSGGQLQVIALCLFLARATRSSTPFRFIVVDDPVQSLDELRVENLVRVLDGVARGSLPGPAADGGPVTFPPRQVVVLTHDDRVRNTIRRLGVAASLKTIERSPTSIVTLLADTDPVEEQLKDAERINSSSAPDWIKERSIAALCRSALEALAYPAFAHRCAKGADVETEWDDIDDTRGRLGKAGGCQPHALTSVYPSTLEALVDDLNKASHASHTAKSGWRPSDLIKRTRTELEPLRGALGL